MSKSLLDLIKSAPANKAAKQMQKELEHIERTKDQLFKLLNYPEINELQRSYVDTLVGQQLEISARDYFNIDTFNVKIYEPTITGGGVISPLNKYSLPTAKQLIKWPLLASDEINYLEAIRQQNTNQSTGGPGREIDSREFGPVQDWVVWYSTRVQDENDPSNKCSNRLFRVRATGPLGLLYLNFPDAVTNHIRHMAGVSMSPMTPIFICRASIVAKYAEQMKEKKFKGFKNRPE